MSAATGPQLRDEGVDAVLAADQAVHRQYAGLVRQAVGAMQGCWTAETVRAWVEEHHPGARPHSWNVLGGTLNRMAAADLIRPSGFALATRPEAHARPLRVWRRTPPPLVRTRPQTGVVPPRTSQPRE